MATSTLSTFTKAYTQPTFIDTDRVLLRPRRYERVAGFLVLVPLLPKRPPLPALPAEIWRRILTLSGKEPTCAKWDLALICKDLKNVALPLLYSECKIRTIRTLEKFTHHLHSSDQKWDSIRRIPYSTPGRWVQSLDLSELDVMSRSEFCRVDELLTTLFSLLPFLSRLELSLSMQLSRRAMASLGLRDGAQNLRVLTGIKYDATTVLSGEDPLTELVAHCTSLEELEVVGVGMDDLDTARSSAELSDRPCPPLHLPRLHTLTILATPTSPLLIRLTHSPLPALQSVVVTPYGDLQRPQSCISEFLIAHGQSIRTLVLHTPKSWPIVRFPPPRTLLHLLPNLRQLSLESSSLVLDSPSPKSSEHPLSSIWISRPTAGLREELIRVLPYIPRLREVRARDVRWAKRGMSARAREAGFQGEMYAWRHLLAPRGVKMLDADGHDEAGC
ncbi:uncharacterized protein FOMMEDRAFT_113748 [Fomitiporia mediterranea MF3/22]|uniref:uncharacterized protein n=1 Tax=Fomitiporia mediterranea (strain MF3/22) TaxID=694068 RepID=UPI00044097BE|nr:uncharacterized protein FOMMEDRAFT_113748 [Fomitiporia mediterranea MF3/22]EJC98596.1 hypothetical protein FOMMEDRAFT_113748 [Fomitiporia mediterranea MF3/22]